MKRIRCRKFLVAAVAALFWSHASHVGAAPDSDRFDDPAYNIEAWVKLEGDTSGRVFYRLSRMLAYGVPKGSFSQPLFGMIGVTKKAYREMSGGYEARWTGCGLYADPETWELIDSFENPYTGEVIPLKPMCSLISGARLTVEDGLSSIAPFAMESTIFGRPYVLDWTVVGDTAFLQREAHTQWQEPSSGKLKHEMTIDSAAVPLAQLDDPAVTSIDMPMAHTLVTEWMTMLKMGDAPGSMLWRADITKHFDAAEIPEHIRAALEKERPGFFVQDLVFDDADAE
ncbi:DUF1838 family protein [Candidatus Foliamicus sp.]